MNVSWPMIICLLSSQCSGPKLIVSIREMIFEQPVRAKLII